MWDEIDPSIREKAQSIAEVGKYDDAIFAAFKYVEAEIQERLGSKSIGEQLLDEAFDGNPPRILISHDTRDLKGIKDIFSGALTNIRNDRGHKKAPLLPCKTLDHCFLYLSFASFLLYLLSKDQNIFPKIEAIRIFGSQDQPRAELRGYHFTAGSKVLAQGIEAPIVQITPTIIEVLLPSSFRGSVKVVDDDNESNEMYCDAQFIKHPESTYKIISADIPLYEDANCTSQRTGVVGLLLHAKEGGREFQRILATYPGRYKSDYYVTHGPFEQTTVGEAWYRDPRTGEIRNAWTGSSIAIPNVLGSASNFNLGSISILPNYIKTSLDERRTLRVIGWGKDGPVQKEEDLTDEVSWKALDEKVAFVKNSVVYPKKLGRTTIEGTYKSFLASAEVAVGHYPKGEKVTYFQGIHNLQQIRFDTQDNLYICNQSASVYRISQMGGLEEVVRLPGLETQPYGIDCIAIDKKHNLYVNDLTTGGCLQFLWDGKKYVNPKAFATVVRGTKKSMVIDKQGHIFVAVMGDPGQGYIIHVEPNGVEHYFPTRDMAIYIALDQHGNICTPSTNRQTIDIYSRDGTFIEAIPYSNSDSPSDLLIDNNGVIYIPFFHSGKIMRIGATQSITTATFIANNLGIPGGIAMDSQGRIYVSNFEGNNIDIIY